MQLLPDDQMPGAEVSLRLSLFLLSKPNSSGAASISIDEAEIRSGDRIIFSVSEFLNDMNWKQIKQNEGCDWHGTYRSGKKEIKIHSNPGRGDVVTSVGQKTIRAECKGGTLIQGPGGLEYSIVRSAIGQLVASSQTKESDIYAIAVPNTWKFRSLIADLQTRPVIANTLIRFVLVDRNGRVEGLGITGQ
jgi:hypothetical protein